MRNLAAVLFGMSAMFIGSQTSHLKDLWRKRRINPIIGKRRSSLLRATGIVHGTEAGLRKIVRQRVLLLSLAAIAASLITWTNPTAERLVLAPALMFGAWNLPSSLARARERRRVQAIELEIVDSLGEMVMGVEVGLTLESVMRLYASRHDTPLGTEFATYLDRIALGATRDTALSEMVQRTPTDGVQMFVAAVRQNQRIGAPLGSVLRQQAATARRRRRQQVEERSAKISMKMVFPTVFCILPALLVVVVGPAIIRTLESLPG